jgi:GT2 family glycosyltransferase
VFSVIVCSIDPVKFARIQQHYQQLFGTQAYELIGIHDARSLCEGYNRGIARSKGEFLIFSHDDIEFLAPQDWLGRLKNHLSRFDVVGLAGTTKLVRAAWVSAGPPYIFGQVAHVAGNKDWPEPYRLEIFATPAAAAPGIQALDGLFIAARRKVTASVSFDEITFDGFHCYDIDFTYCCYLAGFKIAVACDLPAIHDSMGKATEEWKLAARRLLLKHKQHIIVPEKNRRFAICLIAVETKEELPELMLPPHLLSSKSL